MHLIFRAVTREDGSYTWGWAGDHHHHHTQTNSGGVFNEEKSRKIRYFQQKYNDTYIKMPSFIKLAYSCAMMLNLLAGIGVIVTGTVKLKSNYNSMFSYYSLGFHIIPLMLVNVFSGLLGGKHKPKKLYFLVHLITGVILSCLYISLIVINSIEIGKDTKIASSYKPSIFAQQQYDDTVKVDCKVICSAGNVTNEIMIVETLKNHGCECILTSTANQIAYIAMFSTIIATICTAFTFMVALAVIFSLFGITLIEPDDQRSNKKQSSKTSMFLIGSTMQVISELSAYALQMSEEHKRRYSMLSISARHSLPSTSSTSTTLITPITEYRRYSMFPTKSINSESNISTTNKRNSLPLTTGINGYKVTKQNTLSTLKTVLENDTEL